MEINQKEKLLIEYMVSNREIFVKCIRMVQDKYFEKPLDRVIGFVKDYFYKYNNIPPFDVIEAETQVTLEQKLLDKIDHSYVCEELENHCSDEAMASAIMECADLLQEGKPKSTMQEIIRDAMRVKIDTSLGTDLFDNPEQRIMDMDENVDERSCGIPAVDHMVGNIRRGEVGMFSATTSGGKSLMLGNIANNLASQGLHSLIITFELNENLYSKRMDTIITGEDIQFHQEKAHEIAEELEAKKEEGYGSIVTKKFPALTPLSEIRAFILEYKIQKGHEPDAVVFDYIDIMGLDNPGRVGNNKFDIDEQKMLSLCALAAEGNYYTFTASQINRDGYGIVDIGPQHIAGGLSKVNASDFTVAMVATEEDQDNSEVQIKPLKLRNSSKQGQTKTKTLYINPRNLQIRDEPFDFTDKKYSSKLGSSSSKEDEEKSSENVEESSKLKRAAKML